MHKPWQNEFVIDDPDDMDDAAVEILMKTMRGTPRPYFDVEAERLRRIARQSTERDA